MNYYVSSPESSSSGSYYESPFGYGSRPQSTSPTLAQSYPAFAKLRQEACRGFEAEDDLEFCPALVAQSPLPETVAAAMTPVTPKVAISQVGSVQPAAASDAVPTVAVRAHKALEIIDPATGLPIGRR